MRIVLKSFSIFIVDLPNNEQHYAINLLFNFSKGLDQVFQTFILFDCTEKKYHFLCLGKTQLLLGSLLGNHFIRIKSIITAVRYYVNFFWIDVKCAQEFLLVVFCMNDKRIYFMIRFLEDVIVWARLSLEWKQVMDSVNDFEA